LGGGVPIIWIVISTQVSIVISTQVCPVLSPRLKKKS